MISIQLERRITVILDRDDRELTLDQIINKLRNRGHFPAPNGNLDNVRNAIRLFIHGYYTARLEEGDRNATHLTP